MKFQRLFKRNLTLKYKCGAIPISEEEANFLFTKEEIAQGECRGKLKTWGPWEIPHTYTALATSQEIDSSVVPTGFGDLTIYGKRTMTNCIQSGYELEGRVSMRGKKYRTFTSSQLFELPNGKLINCAILHVCITKKQPKRR